VNDKMQLSEIGKIVETEWQKTADLRPDMNLILDKFVVMPNHIHAIIIIGKNEFNENNDENQLQQNEFIPQSKNLSSIIRGYKSTVSKYCKKLSSDFTWQTRFHDRIIRNFDEYNRIAEYITNNPINWKNDTHHTENNA
jgi:REP element-mobilizing transposase RayT